MIVYLDSSFVIRRLLGVGPSAAFWGKWEKAYASTLMRTECCRAAARPPHDHHHFSRFLTHALSPLQK